MATEDLATPTPTMLNNVDGVHHTFLPVPLIHRASIVRLVNTDVDLTLLVLSALPFLIVLLSVRSFKPLSPSKC